MYGSDSVDLLNTNNALQSWSTLVEGDEQLYWPRGKSTSEIVHSHMKQMMFTFMDWVAYWQGRYGGWSPSTKVLHDWSAVFLCNKSTESEPYIQWYFFLPFRVIERLIINAQNQIRKEGSNFTRLLGSATSGFRPYEEVEVVWTQRPPMTLLKHWPSRRSIQPVPSGDNS